MNLLNRLRDIFLLFFGYVFVLLILTWMLVNNCLSGLEFALMISIGFFAEAFLLYRFVRAHTSGLKKS